jgi:hypothetical protein
LHRGSNCTFFVFFPSRSFIDQKEQEGTYPDKTKEARIQDRSTRKTIREVATDYIEQKN